MKHAICKHLGDFAAVVALMAFAVGVGGFMLAHQRLRFPLIEDAPFRIKAEFSTAQAVTPGQGQTVRVAGVKVGDIAQGRARRTAAPSSTMDLDPSTRSRPPRRHALLRPKTGLKDMFVALDPGTGRAPRASADGDACRSANTLPTSTPTRSSARSTTTRATTSATASAAPAGA